MQRFQVKPPLGRGNRSILLGENDSRGTLLLGRLSEVGPQRDVRLDMSKEHVIAVIGKRGSGKSHTLGVLLEGLGISDPTGLLGCSKPDHAILVFDTLNIFQWIGIPLASAQGPDARSQLAKARSWRLPESSVKPRFWHLSGSDPVSADSLPFRVKVADMTPQDWGLLMDVDIATEPMGQLVLAAWDKVTRTGWWVGRRQVSPTPNHSIEDLLKCIGEDKDIGIEFAIDTRRAVRQRLAAYGRTGLFSTEGTPFADLLSPGEVSVLLLARAPEDLRTLVVFLLVRRLLEGRSIASEASKDALIRGNTSIPSNVPRSWVILDEAQNIIPSRTATIANRELTRFVREGRNFGLSMAISTQQPEAIDARVMAQVDVLIAHTLTVRQDFAYVLANLKAPPPEIIILGRRSLTMSDCLRELEVGQAIISAVDAPRTCFVEIRPRVTPHGGFEA